MGRLFNRSNNKEKNKNRKSVFDLSEGGYEANDYGFIKEEQLPQNRSFRRRKILTLIITIVVSAVLFGAIATVVSQLVNRLWENYDDKSKNEIDLRPTGSVTGQVTPGGSEVRIDPEAFSDLEKLYAGVRSTARALNPCIAEVTAMTYTSDPVFGRKTAESRGFYGIVIGDNSKEYLILIRDSELDTAYEELAVTFQNNWSGTARIVQRNSEVNLAVLSVSQKGILDADRLGISVIKFGDSSNCVMGSPLVAIGCVNGRGRSVDIGFVTTDSMVAYIYDDSLDILETNMIRYEGMFGVVVNASGEMVGIITDDFGPDNCLRVITINSIRVILSDLINNKQHAVFGAMLSDINVAARRKMNIKGGILIEEIVDGSPADEAGFRKGDIILKMQGEDVYYVSQFNTILRRNEAGSEVAVTYLRGGEEYEATFKVGISE